MRANLSLIILAGLLAFAGGAAAQNAPCPECDPDGDGTIDSNYHSVDVGVIDQDGIRGNGTDELLADTDVAYAKEDEERGFWLWMAICLSAFLTSVEETLGLHTDVDANAELYADSNGADLDASVTGLQPACDAVGLTHCDTSFDRSPVGDVDGKTWEAVTTAEAATGLDVFAPAAVPDTETVDVDACVLTDVALCG